MKKQLLIGSALFAAISVYSQGARRIPVAGFVNVAEVAKQKFAVEPVGQPVQNAPASSTDNYNAEEAHASAQSKAAAMPPSTAQWKLLCGSSNCYGMLVTHSRPLQYNDNLNAVSFVHRKSDTYTESPAVPAASKTGVIVAEISSNWGTSWDSTLMWADATHAGRYPQGAIYNPLGGSSLANAYIVGSGPTVANNAFTGDWYASKKLNAFSNTPDPTTNAQQFLSFTLTSYPSNQARHSWSRYGFTSTDDGIVRSLALIQNDGNTLGDAAAQRGVAVVTGSFNAGAFTWETDSLIPACVFDGANNKQITSDPQMAWNESGTVGYVVIIGVAATASNNNKGFQPIIYKTTDAGANWTLTPGIDFNAPTMTTVINHINGITSTLTVPYINDYDIAVDKNNNLHFGVIPWTAYSTHNDSLGYLQTFSMSVNPGHQYYFPHRPGFREYLFDIVGDGTNWTPILIDSLQCEDPGIVSSRTGYTLNPWDVDQNQKIGIDNRLQLSRTPSGDYISFSYADSDSNFVNGILKYNIHPDINTRCMAIGTGTGASAYKLSTNKILASKVGSLNVNISGNAMLHYMSPTTSSASCLSSGPNNYTVDIQTPLTITHTDLSGTEPLQQLRNQATWYGKTNLAYSFTGSTAPCESIGIKELASDEFGSVLFPNPAKDKAVLTITMKQNTAVIVEVFSVVGQKVRSVKTDAHNGENHVDLDLTGLSTGVYMVKTTLDGKTSTKKLIIQ